MKRNEPQKLGDILRNALDAFSFDSRLQEYKAIDCWPNVVGGHLANVCGRPKMKNGIMTISVGSPSLRQELNMSRSRLITLLNEAVGEPVVKDLRFVS